MQLNMLCVVAFATLLGAAANKVEVTPVQKVLTLMQGMLEKGKKGKSDESVAFMKSTGFCVDTTSVKTAAIADNKENIGELTATIEKATADIKKLAKTIAKLHGDESEYAGDIKAAKDVRATEKKDFDTTNLDYTESISAIGRAIKTMMGQAGDKAQATTALVQVVTRSNLIPESAKKTLNLFLQEGADPSDNVLLQDLDMAAPEAHGYESQSSGVIDMMKSLQSKFVKEQTTLQANEKNAVNAFNLLVQDLRLQSENAVKQRNAKQVTLSKRTVTRSEKTADRNSASKMLADDEKFLKELKADCTNEKSTYEDRQKLRSEEIVAIEKAIEVISSGAVAGSATKHLPKLLQQSQATSLAGLRSISSGGTQQQVQRHVGEFLQAQAKKINSQLLSAIALHVAADPMKKVKKMVQDLVSKLIEQAASEATHKGQCDTDLAANKKTRTEKTDAIDTLNAEIEGLSAKISKITRDIQTLTDQVSESDKSVKEKTAIRGADTVENKETVTDAKNAQEAIAQALAVLQDFYAKAGDAAALVQQPAAAGESQGVIAMLEVIQSDFARLQAETTASEDSAKKEFEEFIDTSKVDKIKKQASIEHKGELKEKAGHDKTVAQGDLEDEQTVLNAALSTFEKLKPTCLAPPMSYEDRVARRKAEVSNLKEALKMLESEASEGELFSSQDPNQ